MGSSGDEEEEGGKWQEVTRSLYDGRPRFSLLRIKREGVLFIFEAVLVIEDINDNKF